MQGYDITWQQPSNAQDAALEHVLKHAGPYLKRMRLYARRADEFHPPITEYHVADMMCLAKSSLWYTQASLWAEGKSFPAKGADASFQMAGSTIVKIVNLGYSNGVWWDATQIWANNMGLAVALASIIDAVRMLRVVRGRVLAVHSQWFEVLPYLMIPGLNVERAIKALATVDGAKIVLGEIRANYDPGFRKEWLAAKRAAKETISATYVPTPCIHPECNNLVAPKGITPREGHHKNYRGTGACQRGHNSYLCTKCNAPHSFVSGIGKRHYPEFYGKDFLGTDMAGEKWRKK